MPPLIGIPLLSLTMALLLVAAVYRTSGKRPAAFVLLLLAVVMSLQIAVASAGILRQWERRPPPTMVLAALGVLLTADFAFSKFGDAMAAVLRSGQLVFRQAFRIP